MPGKFCHCLATLFVLFSIPASTAEREEEFLPLFNGEDLTGWVNVSTAPSTWKFDDDGTLICSGKPIGEIRTERMYQNFILELKWRHLVPRGNAGVFVWADDITARGQPFIRGVEVQILENAYGNTRNYTTHGDIFPIHGARMTPVNGRGGSRAFPTENRSNPSPEWNHYRIECRDGDISLAVNGKVVTRGKDATPRKGYICLESEGGVVHYRDVRIRELPDTPIEPDQIAQQDRGFKNLYTGVDLSGWTSNDDRWKSRDWFISCEGNGDHPARLSSQASFGDQVFLFDFRLLPETERLQWIPRGSQADAVVLTPENDWISPHLEKTGKWNRVEASVRKTGLVLIVNGREIEPRPLSGDFPSEGPIVFEADSPVEISNLYVRPLAGEN